MGKCRYEISINKLITSQKRAIRNISHAEYLQHTNQLFKNNKLLKLVDINLLESVKFVKKELLKPNSNYFSERYNYHGMALRNNNLHLVNLPQPRTEQSRKFITYSGAIKWNDLPLRIKLKQNPVTFKIHVKKYLLSLY